MYISVNNILLFIKAFVFIVKHCQPLLYLLLLRDLPAAREKTPVSCTMSRSFYSRHTFFTIIHFSGVRSLVRVAQ